MRKKSNHTLLFAALMMTIIIDVMGMGLVIPVLPGLFLNEHSPLLTTAVSLSMRQWLYGLALAAWPLGMFFGNAMVGRLSDRLGRKLMLTVCLLGMTLTYGLGWGAIAWHSASFFVLSRLLNGLSAGSYILAQAQILDISTRERKAINMGWISFAATLGFVVGPLASSFMLHLSTSLTAPFILAMLLAFINLVLLSFLLPDVEQKKSEHALKFWQTVLSFKIIFIDKRVQKLGFAFCILQLSWGFFVQSILPFMAKTYHWNAASLAIFTSVIGLGAMINLLLIQPFIFRFYRLPKVAFWAFLMFALACLSFAVIPELGRWIVTMIASALDALIFSALLAMLSNAVHDDEQGHVIGATGSLFGIAWTVNSLLLAPLMHMNYLMPVWVAGMLVVLSLGWVKEDKETTSAA